MPLYKCECTSTPGFPDADPADVATEERSGCWRGTRRRQEETLLYCVLATQQHSLEGACGKRTECILHAIRWGTYLIELENHYRLESIYWWTNAILVVYTPHNIIRHHSSTVHCGTVNLPLKGTPASLYIECCHVH